MNEEDQNFFPKRERTPKRRSSILKRQDTCVITEDGDEGSRTPRRVSFAKNTMIKEFYSVPWPSHDDSSLHSSKSSQSSSSSSDETHHSTLSEDCGKLGLPEHLLLSTHPGQQVFVKISERESHYEGIVLSDQNKTIHFQDLDSSVGNMSLLSNISELSMSSSSMEDALKHMPNLHQNEHLRMEEQGQLEETPASYRMQEYSTMEMTHNLDNMHRNMAYQKRLSEECTEDMELTADLMSSSWSALVDIPVNKTRASATTGSTKTAVKFGVEPDGQENNPLLLLHSFSKTGQSNPPPLSPPMIKFLESTNMLSDASTGNLCDNKLVIKEPARGVGIVSQSASRSGIAGSCPNQSVVTPCEDRQRQRRRLTDQLTSQVLSPVVEISGLNCSQASTSLSRLRTPVEPSQPGLVRFSIEKPGAGTNSPSTADTMTHTGNIEITKNITCDIEMNESLQHRPLTSDQCQKFSSPQSVTKSRICVEPQTKTIYFNSSDAAEDSNIFENAGDMELTATYCNTPIELRLSLNDGGSEPTASSDVQVGTVYFDTSETGNAGEMRLTETVPDTQDPDIVFNFRRTSSGSVEKECVPKTSEGSLKDTQNSNFSLSKESSLVLDRSEKLNLPCVNSIPQRTSILNEAHVSENLGPQPSECSSKSNQWEAEQELGNKENHLKKAQIVKKNIIKDLNGFLSFSRRSSSFSNKNVTNAQRSLGGLVLSSQKKNKRNSSNDVSQFNHTGQDEVDGTVASSFNVTNSAEVVSVFSTADSPLRNAKIPSLSEKNSQSISPLKENTHTHTPNREQSWFSSQKTKSTTILNLPARENCIASADVTKSVDTSTALSQSDPVTVDRNSPVDFVDKDDPEVTPENLDLHKLVGKFDVDEEALDDFLQNLDSMVSDAEPQDAQTQELVTLEEIYSSVGFDKITECETITFEKEMEIATSGSNILTQVVAVPKLDTLGVFVQDMECAVKKLKEANAEKKEMMRKKLGEVGRQLAADKDKTQPAILEMCQACRMMAKAQWWKHEAGHLIDYSTQREEKFEKLNSDVEFFRKETERCSGLIDEIDKCLQEISEIKDLTKDVQHEEKSLSEINREVEALKLHSRELDERRESVMKRTSDIADSTEIVVAEQDRVREQLSWAESLTEWSLIADSCRGMVFGFLFNTLMLQVQLERSDGDGQRISGVSLRSRLSASSKPWAKLSHKLATVSIDSMDLASKYTSRNQLSELLLDVSNVVCNCRQLSTEIRLANFTDRVAINDFRLDVYILGSKKRVKICLRTQFDPPCNYPDKQLNWNVTTLFGNAQPEVIAEAIQQVPTGHCYLTRVLEAAKKKISHSTS